MNAIRIHQFGGPEVLKLERTDDPAPQAGQILVAIKAIGVNPVETYIRSGIYGARPFPFTPGSDAAGVIEAVGADVGDFKPGDCVYVAGSLTGAYAEKTLCEPAHIHPLPRRVSFAQGAAVGVPYATAYRALFHRAAGRAGETVLVHGASGGVGTAAVQLARAAGFVVLGTAGTEDGRQLVLEQGAHAVFNHHDPQYLQTIIEHTAGRGVDIVLEMLANVNLGKDLAILAKHGRVVVIGSRGKIEIDPRETMRRDAEIRGMTLFNTSPTDLAGIHHALVAGLENGTLSPIVGQQFPLAEAARAHQEVMKSTGAYGKIVLTV